MASSPTARSLQECKKRGWSAHVVEKWNQYARKTFDLFGCIDIVALTDDGIMGIQATSGNNHAARVAKILAEPLALKWVKRGGQFEVWSWAKRGDAGKRKLWTLRTEDVAPLLKEAA